jgi:DNA adenine methylase
VKTREINEVKPEIGKPSPFVKWAGGKRGIIQEIINRFPKKFNTYYEPFLGGGAVFFEICKTSPKCVISDINFDLIITYKVIKEKPMELIKALKKHEKKHFTQEKDEYYYKIRSQHDLKDPVEVASRFIYLNKTCYNGLYRQNKKGEFNVPMGKYKNPGIVQEENILACHNCLKDTEIKYQEFTAIEPQKGDFVYIDPPYHPINSSSFTQYTEFDFTEKDQIRLRDFVVSLHKKGVYIMASNSKTEFIEKIYKYKDFKIDIVDAPRFVNCKSDGRNPTKEVLITNY